MYNINEYFSSKMFLFSAHRPETSSQIRNSVGHVLKCASINLRRSSIPYPKLAPRPDVQHLKRRSIPLTSKQLMSAPQSTSINVARPVPASKAVIQKSIVRDIIPQSNVDSSTFLDESADNQSNKVPIIGHTMNVGNKITPIGQSLFVPDSHLKTYSKLPTDEYINHQNSIKTKTHSDTPLSSKYDRLPSHVV